MTSRRSAAELAVIVTQIALTSLAAVKLVMIAAILRSAILELKNVIRSVLIVSALLENTAVTSLQAAAADAMRTLIAQMERNAAIARTAAEMFAVATATALFQMKYATRILGSARLNIKDSLQLAVDRRQ